MLSMPKETAEVSLIICLHRCQYFLFINIFNIFIYLLFRVFLFVLFVFIYNVFTRFTLQCLSCGCKSFLTCCLSVCRFDLTLNVAVWTFIYLIEALPVHEIWAWVCYWAQHCIQFLVINILVSTIWNKHVKQANNHIKLLEYYWVYLQVDCLFVF